MPCRQLDCRAASQLDGFRLTQRQPDCFCVNLTHVCVHLTSIAFCGLRTRRQPMAWNRRAHQSCSPVVTSLWRVHAAEVGVRFSPCTTDRCPTPAGSRLRAHDTHLAMPEVSSSYRIRHGSVRFRVPKSSVLGCSTKAAVSIGIERGPASYEDHAAQRYSACGWGSPSDLAKFGVASSKQKSCLRELLLLRRASRAAGCGRAGAQ
jgi:hypothetical protein